MLFHVKHCLRSTAVGQTATFPGGSRAAAQSLAFLKMSACGRHAVTGVPASAVFLTSAFLAACGPVPEIACPVRPADRGANANVRAIPLRLGAAGYLGPYPGYFLRRLPRRCAVTGVPASAVFLTSAFLAASGPVPETACPVRRADRGANANVRAIPLRLGAAGYLGPYPGYFLRRLPRRCAVTGVPASAVFLTSAFLAACGPVPETACPVRRADRGANANMRANRRRLNVLIARSDLPGNTSPNRGGAVSEFHRVSMPTGSRGPFC